MKKGISLDVNQCKRGTPMQHRISKSERILTTTAKINNYRLNVIPVRSNNSIPKKLDGGYGYYKRLK